MSRRLAIVLLAIGLAARMVALSGSRDLGLHIADERQYATLAESLLSGRGFAWSTGELTSLRPPLYPAFVAAIWSVTGIGNLQAVRIVQIVLALLTAAITFEIGRRAYNSRVGALAASIVWLYPPLIYLNFTILTETLFTLLLGAFVLLAIMLLQAPRPALAAAAGLALGLAALTRSVLWPAPLLLCPLLVWLLPAAPRRRVALAALVLAGYAAVVAPWGVRNTRLQGVLTMVDTMGGMNLRMGNYEYTPEDRMWDAVSLTGEKSWVYALSHGSEPAGSAEPFTEGRKEKWAQRMAVQYMLAHPGITLRRAAIKFSDLWGLERSFVAGVRQGTYGLPSWIAAVTSVLMVLSSAALLLLAAVGMWMAPPEWRIHVALLLPVVLLTIVHSVVFGHSRYHVPLAAVLAVYAAAAIAHWAPQEWRRRPRAAAGAALLVVVLVIGWARQILVVDGDRVRALVSSVFNL
jgi:4-amino-4-deoxy-L-arabinose transferase-like glycosyltransferase